MQRESKSLYFILARKMMALVAWQVRDIYYQPQSNHKRLHKEALETDAGHWDNLKRSQKLKVLDLRRKEGKLVY